jgi:pyroglutamyl-peptidase
MTTILVTGFGPFPGAPFNPTGPLVKGLARLRRPALADAIIVTHVFPTSYDAVDRELPALLARHKPDAMLMFGLATRAKRLRVETRARNTSMLMPDATSNKPRRHAIRNGGIRTLPMPAPVRALLAAARQARVPITPSHDAGRYLCNYLCWRAAEAVDGARGPRVAAFIHVPHIPRVARPRRNGKTRLSQRDLSRAGNALLVAIHTAARR